MGKEKEYIYIYIEREREREKWERERESSMCYTSASHWDELFSLYPMILYTGTILFIL